MLVDESYKVQKTEILSAIPLARALGGALEEHNSFTVGRLAASFRD